MLIKLKINLMSELNKLKTKVRVVSFGSPGFLACLDFLEPQNLYVSNFFSPNFTKSNITQV